MPGKTFLVLGSGPGIGVAVASVFAVRGFTHIALVARSSEHLARDEDVVQTAIQERGYSCQTKTWPCDMADSTALKKVLKEVESFGTLQCVYYNAARVGGKPPFEESLEAIEADWKLTNIALYETAQWALPLLKQAPEPAAFFVTSTSRLYKEPEPSLVSLSMSKSSQRALVLSLHHYFGEDVHIALVSVGDVVSPEAKITTPENIADKAWALYKQPKGKWEREVEINEPQ